MNSKVCTIFCLLLVLLLTACGKNEIYGRYVYKTEASPDYAWVQLNDDMTYEYAPAMVVSYRPTGTFTVEEDTITLVVADDDVIEFEIDDKGQLVLQSDDAGEKVFKKE
ncbi:hypothetical protein ACR6HW_01970 [Fusibacter sp. JL298sf-3]